MANTVKPKYLDLLLVSLLFLSLPLFFYKLGQSSLVSFDEAWYGDIARNILKTGDIFLLHWNGGVYNDHPPAGFWLIALSEKIFGFSEFAVRFAPAFCGFLSLIIIFYLGKELFNRWVGFASAIVLPSATWFLFRARSGNLDTILTMFFLLTILLALKASKNGVYSVPLSISLGLLFLTKSAVPLTIIPALAIIFFNNKIAIQKLAFSVVVFLLLVGCWLFIQLKSQPDFINYYFFKGLPGVKTDTDYLSNLKLAKEYLHNGIGKWFWLGIFSMFSGLALRQKRFVILATFFITFFLPFIFSAEGHIWHLIPLYPVLILSFIGAFYVLLEKFIKNKAARNFLLVVGVLVIAYPQIKQSWQQFIDIPKFISDEAILSKEAAKYPYQFYIDGVFLPAAVYYSDKKVERISHDILKPMFLKKEPFLLITYQWRLDDAQIPTEKYKILKTDRDKALLLKL